MCSGLRVPTIMDLRSYVKVDKIYEISKEWLEPVYVNEIRLELQGKSQAEMQHFFCKIEDEQFRAAMARISVGSLSDCTVEQEHSCDREEGF